MRNHFANLKNVNCAILFSSNKLSLLVIYTNEVSIYDQQLNMNSYGI